LEPEKPSPQRKEPENDPDTIKIMSNKEQIQGNNRYKR